MGASRLTRAALLCALFASPVATLVAPRSAVAQGFLSPGELSKAHQKLEGDENCAACHEDGRRVNNALCVSCHKPIGASIANHTGLHGLFYKNQPCGKCHVEHLGLSAPQIRWPGGSKEKFDHAQSGWPLRGDHAEEKCNGCHKKEGTFLGLTKKCVSCHEDVHEARLGVECQSCHNESDWDTLNLKGFDHNKARFPLKGLHAKVECAQCHEEPPKYTGLEFEKCTSCHEDPHEARFEQSCESCHTENGWQQFGKIKARHPGVSLAGGHDKVACARCHDKALDLPPSKGDACVSCHRPVHEAAFGLNCAECHASIKWLGLPDAIGRGAHPKTPFPLKGAHQTVECSGCHNPKLPAKKAFRSLEFAQCTSCHSDPHNGEFAARAPNDCASCHTDAAFAPAKFGVDMHAKTQFPLDGKHVAVACGACHEGPRPRLGFAVADRACASCHENPHGDQFKKEMDAGGCASCHSPVGWKNAKVDHSIWPLTGAHATAACDTCHSPTAEDRRSGNGASYRGVPRDCEGCHEDVHLGQFAKSKPVRGCEFCHGTATFDIDPFDHGRLASYPLTGKHEHLECEKCHGQQDFGGELTPVRWRLGFSKCVDCHANPHDSARGPVRGAP